MPRSRPTALTSCAPAPAAHKSSRQSPHQRSSCAPRTRRADQILRFKKELTFVVTTGRHADTALWYQRVAAAAASHDGTAAGGKTPWAANASGAGGNGSSGGGTGSGAGAGSGTEEAGGGSGSGGGGPEGAASFLAAALEGSTNSSRLDAKLAVRAPPCLCPACCACCSRLAWECWWVASLRFRGDVSGCCWPARLSCPLGCQLLDAIPCRCGARCGGRCCQLTGCGL